MDILGQIKNIDNIVGIIKIFFMIIFTNYSSFKIINKVESIVHKKLIILIGIIIITIIYLTIKSISNLFYSTICLIIMLSVLLCILGKESIGYAIFITLITLSINYIFLFISAIIIFIPKKLFNINNILLELIILLVIYIMLNGAFFKIKRFRYGLIFLQKNINNGYIDIFIINISITILFASLILSNYKLNFTLNLVIGFIIFSLTMFAMIIKSLQLYYKQKLLIQDLNETKEELEKKKQEIEQLEKENLNFSKKSHSLAHKQRAIEYQINQLLLKSEIAEEAKIKTNIETELNSKTEKEHTNLEELTKVKDQINKLSSEIYNKTATVELSKTGIFEIDNILEYMQSECNKNEIDFNLQIAGNIYHMINNIIDKEDLQILLADHIKNAIIAIKYANNINKSILVKLGKIENIYSLYIYDSGIEFEKETLMNLGKRPSTTHAKDGGTGMGFMNTFDTLKKYNASLIINEIGKLSKDNYTKVLIIKFDHKCEFKLTSYRQEEIGEISEKLIDKSTTSDIIVENKL